MGLFSFVKNAGKSLFGGKAEAAEPDAETLNKELSDLGLDTKGAEISVAGDKVTVKGGDMSAEERDGAHYEKIFEANKPMLTHPDKIYPGQVLRIPAA